MLTLDVMSRCKRRCYIKSCIIFSFQKIQSNDVDKFLSAIVEKVGWMDGCVDRLTNWFLTLSQL